MKHAPKGRIKAREGDPLSVPDPMITHIGDKVRCKAHSKQKGIQCGRTAIPGGTVCRYHGGLAPQVQMKAQERLMAFQDRALHRLFELAEQREYPSTAFSAVKDVLDRTMGKPVDSVNVDLTGAIALRWQSDESS